ncbi:Transposon TX1 uncharacterized 149 kDa protein [Vitis vinifera]|uniref:Transposon TX1 uncharacterized 149 kDa protein n=1 Tax=Vitis vinifera TaxID=29760 RepID=A0A438EQ99_VITVI|nr:Transposon TX1 uncharacterized 149 kDa protein [Vitis vinifera]
MSGAALSPRPSRSPSRRTSDHWPIVLDTNPFKWGPTPFRFENMWLQHPSFKENFRNWWRGFQGNGWEGHKFMRRLQFVKAKLKEWNKVSFGELNEKKKSILNDLANFDAIEQLYASPTGESWSVEGLDWSPISEESALVFQDCWDVIKEDLVRVFAEFHRSGIINQSTNASFIVLLPKKSLTKKISDFRPISLITSLYKIIAKVLSGRLRGVLHETIHSTQGAFVQGRQIWMRWVKAFRGLRQGGRTADSQESFASVWAYFWAQGFWLAYTLSGSSFGREPKACGFWDPVIERISRRLDGWQKAYLSFGGRITLIQSCLTHMPWIGKAKDHLVSWDVVCKPKAKGGLGFGNISLRNLALLGKWLWRYPREGSALWHQVILSIYGSHSNGWDANTLVRWSHRCPWKAIAQVFQEFSLFTRFVVGNGERIRSGRFVFSVLLVLSLGTLISANLSDSEIEDLEGLMRSLDGLHLSPSVFPSKFVWKSQVPFKVKSFVWLVAHKKHGESADHLFLHCSLTIGLWQIISVSQDGLGPPRSIFDMMSIKFNGFGSSKRGIVLWQAASIALIRVVWWERNARIFRKKARNSEYLWDSIVFLASLWAFCSKVFKGTPLNVLQLDWLAVCTP